LSLAKALERILPGESPAHIVAEHLARYQYASAYTLGRRTLDVACGTGYGAHLLANSGGSHIVGVDAAAEALQTATSRFSHPRLSYLKARAESLPFGNASFERVVCFETLEHVAEPRTLLSEVARVLTPGGRLLVSTPNRKVASPWWPLTRRPANPHHCHEYRRQELEQELDEWFQLEELWGQRFVGRPWLWFPVYATARGSARLVRGGWAHRLYDEANGPVPCLLDNARGEPRYFIAVCSRRKS
jgi:2-polyprenyl-3-methyl-5-hydroxy-6-metoxy-1,4-benzoquinol methylase